MFSPQLFQVVYLEILVPGVEESEPVWPVAPVGPWSFMWSKQAWERPLDQVSAGRAAAADIKVTASFQAVIPSFVFNLEEQVVDSATNPESRHCWVVGFPEPS